MIISYDSVAQAVYVKIKPQAKIVKTVEFAPETFIDLDKAGDLIGIEMLHPGKLILKKLARKYHQPELSRIKPQKLQEAISQR